MIATSVTARPDVVLLTAAAALERRGHVVQVHRTGRAAALAARALVTRGSSYFTSSSRTVESSGLDRLLTGAPGLTSVRQSFQGMDYTRDAARMRAMATAPDVVLGSVQAVTEDGEVVVASGSGSQLASYAYGAGRVVWLVGRQKIVPDVTAGLRRVHEHCLPLEDARARAAYGQPAHVNKILIVSGESTANRSHVLLIEEDLGF